MRRFFRYINYSLKRKMIYMFSTAFAALLIVSFMLSYFVVVRELSSRTINDAELILHQAKSNMDYYLNDVKTPLVTVGRNSAVQSLLSMDTTGADYAERLAREREAARLFNDVSSLKSYMGDLIILGTNGYMMNLITNLSPDFTIDREDWANKISFEKKGIYYILPHEVDYYKYSPYARAISAIFPIYNGSKFLGYVICDISTTKIDAILDNLDFADDTKVYLMDAAGEYVYNSDDSTVRNQLPLEVTEDILENQSGSFRSGGNLISYTTLESNGWKIICTSSYAFIWTSLNPVLQICVLSFVICLLISFLVSLMLVRHIETPLNRLVFRMNQVENNDFTPVVDDEVQYQEIAVIRDRFEKMVRYMDELINKNYLSELRRREVEYDNLSNQINPHFLYNVLQLIQTEAIMSGNEQIEEIVISLSQMMRYALNNKQKLVCLSQEYEYTVHFLELYKKRYRKMFIYTIDIPEYLLEKPVLKFILQPLVENCIRHGFRDRKEGGMISIVGEESGRKIVLSVTDNGCGMSREKLTQVQEHIEQQIVGQSVGLANTNQRLKLQYGDAYGIKVDSMEGCFTKVLCTFPLEEWGE